MVSSSYLRRSFAGLCLLCSLLMLLLGLTVLERRLQGIPFLIYWTVCIFLTTIAALTALLDLLLLRRELRQEQKRLIEQTLRETGDAPNENPEP